MQNFSEKKKTKQTENQCFKYCGDGPSCSEDNLEEFFKNHSGKDGMFCVAVQIQENVSQIAMETPSLMMLCQALQRVLYDEDVDYVGPQMPMFFARNFLEVVRKSLAVEFNNIFKTKFKE